MTTRLKPFFTFYGGKWRAAPHYPKPVHKTIIEPFAGSAGYSLRYYDRDVILVDLDPVIAATWRYLIAVSPSEILGLPDIEVGQSVDDLDITEEARYLIGWWCTRGGASPNKTLSAWGREQRYARQFWGPVARERIATQVDRIRHWRIIEGTYNEAPEIEATWFIDPPYQIAGKYYRHSADRLDFKHLGQWCRARYGQVLVCENVGATWLPFTPWRECKSNESLSGGKSSKEALWTNEGEGALPVSSTPRNRSARSQNDTIGGVEAVTTLYNENDSFPVQWLRNLSAAGHIAQGKIDDRSIIELTPQDVRDYAQFHAFAGIGAWSYALRLAGWPDWLPVWTGSCPCQPFSIAGKGKGTEDKRHFWPFWRDLIAECLPGFVFGEQVASPSGRAWLDTVQAEMEALGYVFGAADLCAAGIGAPHIRQRLFFGAARPASASRVIDGLESTGAVRGHWADAEWLVCRNPAKGTLDLRPVEPGTFPLDHGAAARVGRVHAYGNAIVPQVAAEFIEAFVEAFTGNNTEVEPCRK